jgi:hypothetical protein
MASQRKLKKGFQCAPKACYVKYEYVLIQWWIAPNQNRHKQLYIFFLQVTTVESTHLERTVPGQTHHCRTPEVIDLVDSENYNYSDCGESPLEASGGASRVLRGQYKQQSVPASSSDINFSSSPETNDDPIEHMLVAVEDLRGQVEMLMKSMILMEERLTLIEDKTKGTASTKH